MSYLKLALLYFVAGLAFAPFGAAYAVLSLWLGWDHLLVAAIFLACGTLAALFVWRRVEKMLGGA